MFILPELPYAYNALEPYIDERTMQIHHDKHHAAYVKNINDGLVGQDALLAMPVEKLIAGLSQVPEAVRTKVRNNGGGHANHSLFWEIMAPFVAGAPQGKPSGELKKAMDATFGSLEKFQEIFSAAALNRFGSGWAWLARDEKGNLHLHGMPNQDSPYLHGHVPVIGLDVWEHAYYLKYQNRRAEYIENWWKVLKLI